MSTPSKRWKIISKDQTSWWSAEEHDPKKAGVWTWTRAILSGLTFGILQVGAGRAFVYRLENESTGERKNVYSKFPFEVGTSIEECDWEAELSEDVFKNR